MISNLTLPFSKMHVTSFNLSFHRQEKNSIFNSIFGSIPNDDLLDGSLPSPVAMLKRVHDFPGMSYFY